MNLERAGIRPPTLPSWFPRELRVPVSAARTLLSILTASTGATALEVYQAFSGTTTVQIAEAADPCNVRLLAIGLGYIDNPVVPNRFGLMDSVDWAVAAPPIGEIVLNTRDDVKDSKSKRTEIARANTMNKGDHEEVLFKLSTKSNTKGQNGKEAVQLLVSAASDKIRSADDLNLPVEKAVTVECGQDGWTSVGRYATEEAINTVAKNPNFSLRAVGTIVDQVIEQVFGKGRKPGIAPASDNPAENLKIFNQRVGDIKEHAKQVRAKEKAAAQGTPTTTPTVTPTKPPEASPTPTYTPTPIPGKGENIPQSQGSPILAIGGSLGGVALIGGLAYVLWRKFHH